MMVRMAVPFPRQRRQLFCIVEVRNLSQSMLRWETVLLALSPRGELEGFVMYSLMYNIGRSFDPAHKEPKWMKRRREHL